MLINLGQANDDVRMEADVNNDID